MMNIAAAQRKIDAVDKRIDAVRAELFRNETVDEMSAHSWQIAWDRHPELRAIESSLFIRRTVAADIRDNLLAKEARAAELRAAREYRKQFEASRHACPTCGHEHHASQVAA